MRNLIANNKWHYQLQLPMGQSIESSTKKISNFDKKIKTNFKKIPKKRRDPLATSSFSQNTVVELIKPGIKLVHRHSTLSSTFNLQAYIKGGLTEETLSDNGKFNLLTGLLNADTENKSKDESKFFFESLAASFSSFSGKNAYGLNLSGISDKFDELSTQFFDHLLNSKFTQKDLDFEKLMVRQSLLAQKEDPVRQCFDNVAKIAFGSHPYSMKSMGTEESIENIKLESLVSIHNKNLRSNNILFVYSGPTSIHQIRKKLNDHLVKLPNRVPFKKTPSKKYIPLKEREVHTKFDREQTHIFIGKPTKKLESKETIFFKLIHTYLYGQSSPLFTELRDKKGLCYSVSPINFNALEGGYFGIYIGCSNEKASDSIKEIKLILNNLKNLGLSKTNFKQLVKMSVGQFELSLQTNEDYCNTFATPFLHGLGLDYYFEEMEEIKKLKYEDFQQGIKKALSGKYFQVTSGAAQS